MKWSKINAVDVNVRVKSSGNINQLLGMLYSMVDKFKLRNNIRFTNLLDSYRCQVSKKKIRISC